VGQILPFVPRVVFDDADTRIMGEAFDAACEEVRDDGQPPLAARSHGQEDYRCGSCGRARRKAAAGRGVVRVEVFKRPNLKLRHAEVPAERSVALWSELGGHYTRLRECRSSAPQLFLYPAHNRFGNGVNAKINGTPIP
jgi:hypothetical protein